MIDIVPCVTEWYIHLLRLLNLHWVEAVLMRDCGTKSASPYSRSRRMSSPANHTISIYRMRPFQSLARSQVSLHATYECPASSLDTLTWYPQIALVHEATRVETLMKSSILYGRLLWCSNHWLVRTVALGIGWVVSPRLFHSTNYKLASYLNISVLSSRRSP